MRINIFEKLWQRKPQPEEKAVRAIPKYGRERIWFVWSNHWITLIEMNLLFVLLCIPIITIPAALAGMTRVIMLWTRDAPTVDFWPTFFKSFKKGFMQFFKNFKTMN